MHVLICSPNPSVTIQIEATLEAVDIACEVEPAPQEFGSLLFRDPDAIGLFLALGPESAAKMCRDLRMGDVRNPLFALIDEQSIVFGAPGRAVALNAGADDVQPWPIDVTELVSRLFALQRRQRDGNPSIIQLPGCILKPATGELVGDVAHVHLTHQETVFLTTLASRPGAVMTKPMLMLALYNGRDEAQLKIVDVLICKLRKKIAAATGGLDVLETVWGQGVRFIAEGYQPSFSAFGQRVPG
ncbi:MULTISPECIES: response regulator transcription factor [unclassified Mesorhizobium]|uniref:response regulator transcription factor n=2 Tax=Mesorhizobium TaxID=68287 RepID=UPI000FCBF768|nr:MULTISPECIES: response regulator transcription factor [unclassified Mesorhizobium]TGP22324.1 response regulator transcription factor [Mesorhizobium sp. M1D.F.Ca.ET.231.01.1.1]TGP24706.1 response regulator transcription factor [Mesorhizobium sp. M1D.F.Ca.ET.234.01.1.1]TGS37309.1 response regulator transcription factor [Mesorhizobium sp. M1D.F.Ca.ET.184.01.1.1]TGS58109.1 response regulator transcription factor [Mesorhizobium sp. M1D.F.Ca.ET.183.01.1.1]